MTDDDIDIDYDQSRNYNAWEFSRGWASVALAQSNDAARPALYRTTLIEEYPTGVRLVSTDSYLLLKAWVADADNYGAPEPLAEELPDRVAICTDRDQRVLAMMKYAQQLTRGDGADTPTLITFEIGDLSGVGNTLEGMNRSSVKFRLSESYDERIESPLFEGVFPNWRPLWLGHRWKPTQIIGLGADAIGRLGKLSSLWGKASIEFELGGSIGVAKLKINAPDVIVSGLIMPVTLTREVPASEEVEDQQLGDALDSFFAEVLRTEKGGDGAIDPIVAAARDHQLRLVAEFVFKNRGGDIPGIAAYLSIDNDRAQEILTELTTRGILDGDGFLVDDLAELPEDLRVIEPDDEPKGDDDEPL